MLPSNLPEEGVSEEIKDLPQDFKPTSHDAIVGWARQHYYHPGNQKLRSIVNRYVSQYVHAPSKKEKGKVIETILMIVRRESPSGAGLVRQDPKTRRWSYIGLEKAKDKIGHALRKASVEYRRRFPSNGNHCHQYHDVSCPLAESSSTGSLIDSATSATRSMSGSDSEGGDSDQHEEMMKSDPHSMGPYSYPTQPYPQYAYQTSSASAYPYYQHSLHMYQHPLPTAVTSYQSSAYYHPYRRDPETMQSYYQPSYPYHSHHSYGNNLQPYHYQSQATFHPAPREEESHYDVSRDEDAQDRGSFSPLRSLPADEDGYESPTPSSPSRDDIFTPQGPDPWARAILESTLPY